MVLPHNKALYKSSDYWYCRKFIFTHPVYLLRIPVKFAYECHQVKVLIYGWSCRKSCCSINMLSKVVF